MINRFIVGKVNGSGMDYVNGILAVFFFLIVMMTVQVLFSGDFSFRNILIGTLFYSVWTFATIYTKRKKFHEKEISN